VAESGLRIAVPVASPRTEESELEGDISEPGPEIRVVAGVPRLNGIQALVLQPFDHRPGASFLQMRDGDHATCSMHHVGHFPKRG
jgi:hypothetical protein